MCTYNQILSGATSKGCVYLTLSVTVSRASRALTPQPPHTSCEWCVWCLRKVWSTGLPLPYTLDVYNVFVVKYAAAHVGSVLI